MSGNAMFSCTFMLLQSEHFPFINCVETLVYEHNYPQWESCFEKLGLDPKPISDCFSSGHGKEVGFLQLNLTLNFPFKWRKLFGWKYQDAHLFFFFWLSWVFRALRTNRSDVYSSPWTFAVCTPKFNINIILLRIKL